MGLIIVFSVIFGGEEQRADIDEICHGKVISGVFYDEI